MPALRTVADHGGARYWVSLTDWFWVLFLVAWTAFGINQVIQDVAEYRLQQKLFAERHEPIPPMAGRVPYDSTVDQRLIGEAAGCVITLAVVFFGIRRRRQRVVEARVKWVAAPTERIAVAPPSRPALARRAQSGSTAADRLSAVVWTDHVARVQKEHA